MSDPLDNLPADVRAAVDRFNAARSRVAMAMIIVVHSERSGNER